MRVFCIRKSFIGLHTVHVTRWLQIFLLSLNRTPGFSGCVKPFFHLSYFHVILQPLNWNGLRSFVALNALLIIQDLHHSLWTLSLSGGRSQLLRCSWSFLRCFSFCFSSLSRAFRSFSAAVWMSLIRRFRALRSDELSTPRPWGGEEDETRRGGGGEDNARNNEGLHCWYTVIRLITYHFHPSIICHAPIIPSSIHRSFLPSSVHPSPIYI